MKVGYVGYSKSLEHPADRRRIGIVDGIELNTRKPLESDLLLLSNDANFSWWMKRANQPVVLDLVDAYLGESPNIARDALRNVIRSLAGKSSLRWVLYTRHLKYAAIRATAIIVGSEEQREVMLPYNKSVFVIPDDHSEIDQYKLHKPQIDLRKEGESRFLFWEGYGYTFKHFKHISKELDGFLLENDLSLCLVTTPIFHRWGGYIGKIRVQKLVEKWFPLSSRRVLVVPWSLENLTFYSSVSSFGIIPIIPNDKFARLKPENKLISMWRLGLPTLSSDIPSYVRVSQSAGVAELIVQNGQWARKIDQILMGEFNLNSIRNKQLNFVQEHYSREKLQLRWLNILESYNEKIT